MQYVNNTQAFTFYRNYYEITKYLQPKDRLQLYDAILEYMFEDKEPELKELLSGIWVNIKRPLDNNKKNIKNGQKGGRIKEPKQNPTNNPKETQKKPKQEPKAKANNISIFLFLISNFKFNNNINKLLEEYLEIRKKYKYTITESIVNRLCKKLIEYGETDEEKEQIILNAINGGWKDFYELKEKKVEKNDPLWLNKEQQQELATNEEQEEIKKMLESYRR